MDSVAIILLTVFLSSLIIVHRSWFSFTAGPLEFTHWMSWAGGLWIAFVTPIYYLLKHSRPKRIRALIRIHMFGNLGAFLLISVHFTYWVIFVSFIGTGMALFVAAFALVATGLLQRFAMLKSSRRYVGFIHISMTTAFYLILTVHILSHLMRL